MDTDVVWGESKTTQRLGGKENLRLSEIEGGGGRDRPRERDRQKRKETGSQRGIGVEGTLGFLHDWVNSHVT